MNSPNSSNDKFLAKLTEITEANITNPQFGVSMLAKELGMSRYNLHRKVNEITKITVSQFINQIRLKKAKEILRHTSNTVSEVAYEVGFSNVSYFIKCFHEYYGYSPGEVGSREKETEESYHFGQRKIKLRTILISMISVVLIIVVFIFVFKPLKFQQKKLEKTIAILPAQSWETIDSIAIDGILRNLENNLCKISDIKVVSWISVLQYKNSLKPAPEIAKELGVNYLVKPRVWKNDNKIYLSVTFIEGLRDKTLRIPVYKIDSTNITAVHQEILRDIADEIDISITPTEQVNIDKLITSNKNAIKYYWEGVNFINLWRSAHGFDQLDSAMTRFKKALDYDRTCASAYAQIARMNYIIGIWSPEEREKYGELMYEFVQKALFYDSDLDLSLVANALYNQYIKNYELAEMYFKKALEYNPNSYSAIYYLSYLYLETDGREKFLENAVKAVNFNTFIKDNSGDLDLGYICFRIGDIYSDLGFFQESLKYYNKAIELKPDFTLAKLRKSGALFRISGDFHRSKEFLLELVQKDSTNKEILRLLAISCYVLSDYPCAAVYFRKMLILGQPLRFDAGRFAVVSLKTGETENVKHYINELFDYANTLDPEGKAFSLIGYYSLTGDIEKAIEQMQIFSTYNNQYFDRLQILRMEPIYDNIRERTEFNEILSQMENRYNERRDSIRVILEKKGLL